MFKDHLEQLIKAGHLKEFVVGQGGSTAGQTSGNQGNAILPPLRIIEDIHAASIGVSASHRKGILSITSQQGPKTADQLEKRLRLTREPIAFGDDDLKGTSQPHDDTFIMAMRIGGFLVKRVLKDEGNGAEIMYPDLHKSLGLEPEDLVKYDTPLVGFDGKVVVPERQISLLVMIEGKKVMVNFIVVNAFSPYTTILGRPWIHAMGAVLSALHMKIKFKTEDGIAVVRGD